jgi:formiminoglutamase
MLTRSKCCIIGIPDHLGVLHVGGRIGAARGPDAFRKFFPKFQGKQSFKERVHDAGNLLNLSADIHFNHQQAAEMIATHHSVSGLSVIVGGGHDHGFSHLLGIQKSLEQKGKGIKLGCINIDAHLDVRKPDPLISRALPFTYLLKQKS